MNKNLSLAIEKAVERINPKDNFPHHQDKGEKSQLKGTAGTYRSVYNKFMTSFDNFELLTCAELADQHYLCLVANPNN